MVRESKKFFFTRRNAIETLDLQNDLESQTTKTTKFSIIFYLL